MIRDFASQLSLMQHELELMLLTAIAVIVAFVLSHWICGCYEPKQYFPPRKNPSTGHRIEKERA